MRSVPSLMFCLALIATGCDSDTTDTDVDTGTDSSTDSETETETDPDTGTDDFIDGCAMLPRAQEGICDIAPGSKPGLILRGTVLLPERAVEGGMVILDAEGNIECAGCDCELPADVPMITCADGVISPGLIDPHDHVTFSEAGPMDVGDRRWDHRHGWRKDLRTPSNKHGTGKTGSGTQWAELRRVFGGSTSLVGSGWAEGLVRNLDRSDGRMNSALPKVDNDTFPLGDANRTFRENCGWNFSVDAWQASLEDAYVPHVAEGINRFASEEFRCLSSDFDRGQDIVEPNAALVHGMGLSTLDYSRMVHDDTVLIWSPRSNLQLYGETARVSTFATLGGTIALGSDWTYSGSIHPGRELACADEFNSTWLDGRFSDRELWWMTTRNAAKALRAQDLIGSLAPDYLGDIAIFDGSQSDSPWRAVIDSKAGGVALVLRGGVPLYGEQDVLDGLNAECEALDVCGQAHALCLKREIGKDYAKLQSEVNGAYPAFFCGDAPDREPLCAPVRPGDWPGYSADGDMDGDGVADDVDVCPSVFDPIRPIDGGAQLDADGDGVGDACDESPLPADIDGDGVANAEDNCPYDANGPQVDTDGDKKGDVCDACADVANVGTACPPAAAKEAALADIRSGKVALGTRVLASGVVTGVWGSGFTMQHATEPVGVAVYVGKVPKVSVGDAVQVTGEVSDYYDELQIASESLVNNGATTAVAPVSVSMEVAVTEAYEGVLVRITGEVSSLDHDCSKDNGACKDSNLWEIGGKGGVVVYDRYYDGVDWDSQKGTVPVSGLMTTRFDRRRLMPRGPADFK